MRLQLALALVVVTAVRPAAFADGSISVRGVYYKERATRVMQPMLDGVFEAGAHGLVTGHFLVDAITSASASAGAADAKPFTERRYEAGGGYTHDLGSIRVGGDAKYSTESDYKSLYGGVRGELDLAQKNTLLGLGGGISRDTISAGAAGGLAQMTLQCEPGQVVESTECNLTSYAMFASASQILSRNAVIGISVDLAKLDGYQSNPYRSAIGGDELVAERHPTSRNRAAFAASARYFLGPTNTTLIAAYRYYRDSWKIHAHTPEVRAIQQVGRFADASVRYRYHHQDDAFFYRTRYPTAQEMFVSDDVKLSNFANHTVEAKLGIFGEAFELQGRWAGARFEGILQYVVQQTRFGNAIIAHVALTVPFGN